MSSQVSRPRTASDFDRWFTEAGGDPWGYRGRQIARRLDASCGFIAKSIGNRFSGCFLELGAFNGSFTTRLLSRFPHATICVNDISSVAIDMARRRIGDKARVRYFRSDFCMLSRSEFRIPPSLPVIVLMLECLYYLEPIERSRCLDSLGREFVDSSVFVSTPITGRPYFTEGALLRLFRERNFTLADFAVLNLRWRLPLIACMLEGAARHCPPVRHRLANQVVFHFAPCVDTQGSRELSPGLMGRSRAG